MATRPATADASRSIRRMELDHDEEEGQWTDVVPPINSTQPSVATSGLTQPQRIHSAFPKFEKTTLKQRIRSAHAQSPDRHLQLAKMTVAPERSDHLFEYQDERTRRILANAVASTKRPFSAVSSKSINDAPIRKADHRKMVDVGSVADALSLPALEPSSNHDAMNQPSTSMSMVMGSPPMNRRIDAMARPDFLQRLLQYTSEELHALGLKGAKPGTEGRLTVFREVFDVFIDEFKSYRTLLSDIKNEYEAVLSHHQQQNLLLEPYKKQLFFSKYEAAKQLDEFHQQVNADLQNASKEVKDLKKTLTSRDIQIKQLQDQCESLKQQVASKQQLTEQLSRCEGQISDLESRLMQTEAEAARELQKQKDVELELKKSLETAVKNYEMKTDECNSIIVNSVNKSLYNDAMEANKSLKEELAEAKRDIEAGRAECAKMELENSSQRLTISRLESLGKEQTQALTDWNALVKSVQHHAEEDDPLDLFTMKSLLQDIDTMLPRPAKKPVAPVLDPLTGEPVVTTDSAAPQEPPPILADGVPDAPTIADRRTASVTTYKERARMARRPEDFVNSLIRQCIDQGVREDIYQKTITTLHQHLSEWKASLLAGKKKKKGGKKGAATAKSNAPSAAVTSGGKLAADTGRSDQALPSDYKLEKFIVCLGTAPSVPPVLRHNGSVRNRMLGKAMVVMLVTDLWKEKFLFDANTNSSKRMSDVLHLTLKKRFRSDDLVLDWAYNIHDACRRWRNDATDCHLFLEILFEHTREHVYVALRKILQRVRQWFEQVAEVVQSSVVMKEEWMLGMGSTRSGGLVRNASRMSMTGGANASRMSMAGTVTASRMSMATTEEEFVTASLIPRQALFAEMNKEEFCEMIHPQPLSEYVPHGQQPAVPPTVALDSPDWTRLFSRLKDALEKDQPAVGVSSAAKLLNFHALFDNEPESQFFEIIKRHCMHRLMNVMPMVAQDEPQQPPTK